MGIKTNPLIGTVLSLKHQKNSDKALDMLMQAANLVHPIMKKRNWTVKTMREFLPKDPMLLGLNVNRGLEIRIRLRPHYAPDLFYPFDDILGTVLHELVHNRISPHNDAFNALLDELWREVDDLRASGLTGDGARIGGRNATDSKKAAADAAERRRKLGMLSSGGQRLGGSRAIKGLTPREAAAQAALRRHMDATRCGNKKGAGGEEGTGVVEEEDGEVEFVGETTVGGGGKVTKVESSRHQRGGGSKLVVAPVAQIVVLSDDDNNESQAPGRRRRRAARTGPGGDDDDSDSDDVVLVAVREYIT